MRSLPFSHGDFRRQLPVTLRWSGNPDLTLCLNTVSHLSMYPGSCVTDRWLIPSADQKHSAMNDSNPDMVRFGFHHSAWALARTPTDLSRFIVVRAPEEASSRENAYDYVILCVKALPDVYDLASVIESVVTPQHTCILVNTTNTLGIEAHLEQRYPTNVILSLVSNVEISQTGPSEFEHLSSSEIYVGATNKSSSIPTSIQSDMAAALAMTLNSGQVDCKVSDNIRQEQFDRMIGWVTSDSLGSRTCMLNVSQPHRLPSRKCRVRNPKPYTTARKNRCSSTGNGHHWRNDGAGLCARLLIPGRFPG